MEKEDYIVLQFLRRTCSVYV